MKNSQMSRDCVIAFAYRKGKTDYVFVPSISILWIYQLDSWYNKAKFTRIVDQVLSNSSVLSVLGGQYFLTSLFGGMYKKCLGLLCGLQYIPVDFHWDNPFIL